MAHANANDRETQVNRVIRDFFVASDAGESELMRKVFHPGAVMFSVDDGELYGVTQPRLWADLDAADPPTPAERREAVRVDVDGSLALAKTVSTWPTQETTDYLLLVHGSAGWCTVARVSNHRDPSAPTSRSDDKSSIAAVTDVVQSKIDSHWTYDAELLGESHHPRAAYHTLVEGTVVADSVAEWQRRYAQERRAGRLPAEAEWQPTWVDVTGDAAGAKAVLTTNDGLRVIDYFALLRLGSAWRIIDVTWVVDLS